MTEIIVRYKDGNDHMAVRGGEYVRDLVRCRDCKHWQYGKDHCALHDMGMWAEDFCSYGERREP